jgi:hypothetical protein
VQAAPLAPAEAALGGGSRLGAPELLDVLGVSGRPSASARMTSNTTSSPAKVRKRASRAVTPCPQSNVSKSASPWEPGSPKPSVTGLARSQTLPGNALQSRLCLDLSNELRQQPDVRAKGERGT